MVRRILAVASAGGHWQQLMLMRPAFSAEQVHYVTTLAGLPEQFDAAPASLVPDCNRNTPLRAILCCLRLMLLIARHRPHIIISTGALPGVLALALGRLTGAKTIWVDSVANAQEMSSSGRLAKRFARLCLSQWEAPARAEGVKYAGSVL
ncbi:MAG: UDP-N-acetylglucosamine--LPS N-acetylglucosamine transferase [Paracoccaceae bacterium]